MKHLLFLCVVGVGLVLTAAEEHTVSSPETLSTVQSDDSAWSPLHINADLTVASDGKLYGPYNAKFYLPDVAGTEATLTADGGIIEFYYPIPETQQSAVVIGRNGGKGHVVLKTAGVVQHAFNHIFVHTNAEADATGYVDFLRLENGQLRVGEITVASAAPARFTCAGGYFVPTQDYTGNRSGDIFRPGAGKRLVLYAEKDIRTSMNAGTKPYSFNMNAGEGIVETKGPGGFCIYSSTGRTGDVWSNAKAYFNVGPERLVWGHAGDLVLSNGVIGVVSADNALPCGPQTGNIRLTTFWDGCSPLLDLAGQTAGVNSLFVHKDLYKTCGGVTNSSETTGVLEFGRFDMDTVCEARQTYGDIVFRKVGKGTLTVRNTTVDTLEVTAGVCRIGAGVKAAHVRVTGGSLDILDSAPLDCSDVTCTGTGVIRRVFDADTALSSGVSSDRALCVANGTLTVYDADRDNRYWRLVIRQAHNWYGGPGSYMIYDEGQGAWTEKQQTICLALQRFFLFDYLGAAPVESNRLNANLTEAPVGTAAADLQAGQIASAKPYLTGSYCYNGTDMNIASKGAESVTKVIGLWGENIAWNNAKLEIGKPATWETLTMRLKDTAGPVASFIYVTSGYSVPELNPAAISVACSADGNEPWTVKYGNDNLGNRHYSHPAFYPSGNVTALTNNPHGSFNACPQIEVAAGAALVFDNVPRENIAFNGLAVDLDRGAGTISYFAAAANGALHLRSTNSVELSVLANGPTLTEVGGTKRDLRTWKVYVNGVEMPRLRVTLTEDGRLALKERQGLLMIFR